MQSTNRDMHPVFLILVFMALASPCLGESCYFPFKMTGSAVKMVPPISYNFTVDILERKAIFRDMNNLTGKYEYLDFVEHKKYDRTEDGNCWITPINKTVELPLGMPDDSVITFVYPKAPSLPRQLFYKTEDATDLSTLLITEKECLPEEGPFFLYAPSKPMATLHITYDATRWNTPELDVDLTDCRVKPSPTEFEFHGQPH